jgi:phospholipase C
MIISIVNRSASIADAELQRVIRSINRQIAEDFEPYWSFGANLRLEGVIGKDPDKEALPELRGDAVIYVWDHADMENALGYHDKNARGIPYGFVFTEISRQLKENWTVTLSHEALELVGDAEGNLLVQGPHPQNPAVEVFHWFEMCDAVQAQTYLIDGVEVSNFVLPLYFTIEEQEGGRNDFLGVRNVAGEALSSFGVSTGGYVGFYDPRTRTHETYARPGDELAQTRLQVKAANHYGRGFFRRRIEAPASSEEAHLQVVRGAALVKSLATPADDPIKHVVVLMLENRSFDQMLGGLTKITADVEGVRRDGQSYFNIGPGNEPVYQTAGAAWSLDQKQDPQHEHANVMTQMGGAQQPMTGFVGDFVPRYPQATSAQIQQVMAYFEFGDLPEADTLTALHTLARNFAVCDRWFSSMPGPTWQNRFFVHSATCLGHLNMPSGSDPWHLHAYYQTTIYDRLSDANVNWKIYYDGIPQSIVLTRLWTRYVTGRGYASMDDFVAQAAGNPDDFPEYAFIEPLYFGNIENDQHPPADVRRGEQLIATVYNALRKNEDLWKSTLLIVAYDEHGGFFDHVYPPATVAPDEYTTEWTFDQLGVRVPAILVSPWIAPGVIHTVFDHTSLLRYLTEKWNLAPLGLRMQQAAGPLRANTFGPELKKLDAPRKDTPMTLTAAPTPKAMAAMSEPPIQGSREALLLYVQSLPTVPMAEDVRAAKARTKPRATKGAGLKASTPKKPSALSVEEAIAKLEALRAAETKTRKEQESAVGIASIAPTSIHKI